MSRSLVTALLLVAVAAAACAGPTRTDAPSASSALPAATPGTSTGEAGRHADPALEALLPAALGGVTLTRESQRGTELSRQSEALDAMLANLGRTLADFSLASAYSAAGDVKAQVGAWRVKGAASARLLPEFITAVQASSTTPLSVAEVVLAGRTVTRIGISGELTQGPIYAFVRDDVVLFVQTPDPQLAEQALAALQ